jgi:hypothetical protein
MGTLLVWARHMHQHRRLQATITAPA